MNININLSTNTVCLSEQCVGMFCWEKASRVVLSVAPGFPDRKYISSLKKKKKRKKAAGTWSSKFCQLNKTNSSLVPFNKSLQPWLRGLVESPVQCAKTGSASRETLRLLREYVMLCFFSFVFFCREHHSLSRCSTAWRQFKVCFSVFLSFSFRFLSFFKCGLHSVARSHKCLFMCRERWSDLEKARSHFWHWKGRWPVCFL